jgi:phage/plasmid-like protein (TIGR03299 family)
MDAISIREDGTAEAAFADLPAWHGLGEVVDGARCSEEMLQRAHLDFEVGTRPLYRQVGPDAMAATRYEEVDTHKETYREDSGAALGVVGIDYGVVQGREAFAALDGLVKDGRVRYESAFALHGGREVCVTARLGEAFHVTDTEIIEAFCLLKTSHDGGSALMLAPGSIRPVCANTVGLFYEEARAAREAAEQGGKTRRTFQQKGLLFTLRHSPNVKKNLDDAVALIAQVMVSFARHGAQARRLAEQPMDDATFEKLLDAVMPLPQPVTAAGSMNPNFPKAEQTRAHVRAIRANGPLCNLPGIGGTAWAAFNAYTEWMDHHSEVGRESDGLTEQESAFRVRVLGRGAELKAQAWRTTLQLAGIEA